MGNIQMVEVLMVFAKDKFSPKKAVKKKKTHFPFLLPWALSPSPACPGLLSEETEREAKKGDEEG